MLLGKPKIVWILVSESIQTKDTDHLRQPQNLNKAGFNLMMIYMIIGLNFGSITLHDKDVSKKIMTIFAEYITTILTILNASLSAKRTYIQTIYDVTCKVYTSELGNFLLFRVLISPQIKNMLNQHFLEKKNKNKN